MLFRERGSPLLFEISIAVDRAVFNTIGEKLGDSAFCWLTGCTRKLESFNDKFSLRMSLEITTSLNLFQPMVDHTVTNTLLIEELQQTFGQQILNWPQAWNFAAKSQEQGSCNAIQTFPPPRERFRSNNSRPVPSWTTPVTLLVFNEPQAELLTLCFLPASSSKSHI